MSDKTKKLTSTGATSTMPSGNALLSVNAQGAITPVTAEAVQPNNTVRSTVTPTRNEQWLRVAATNKAPFVGIISVCGTYLPSNFEGKPFVFAVGCCANSITFIQNNIIPIVKSNTVSKIRAVVESNRTYIDLMFARGEKEPLVTLSGGSGIELVTPSIAPEPVDESKVYVYTVTA